MPFVKDGMTPWMHIFGINIGFYLAILLQFCINYV